MTPPGGKREFWIENWDSSDQTLVWTEEQKVFCIHVIEYSAFIEAKEEIERLNGVVDSLKQICDDRRLQCDSHYAENIRLRQALIPLFKWARENHQMPNYSEVILNAELALMWRGE